MGKGARSREKNAVVKVERKEKQQKEQKMKKRNRLILGAVALVLVAAIGTSSLLYTFQYGNGNYLRQNVVASTENYQVDNAMMTYYLRSSFAAMQANYGEYFSMLTGIDTAKSLKNQETGQGGTWFDSLLETTKTSVEEMLVLVEKAKAEGMSLSDSEKTALSARVERMDASFFTGGVSKEDVKKATELSTLAQKYRGKFNADTTFTKAEVEAYFKENKNTYTTAGYRSYVIPYAVAETESSEAASSESSEAEAPAFTFTPEDAKAKATALKAATTEQDFNAQVKALVMEQDTTLDETGAAAKIDATLNNAVTYSAGDEVSEWAFHATRKVGETYLTEDTTAGQYTVYFLTTLPARDESPRVNVRHMLFSLENYGSDEESKAKAEEVMALYEADKTEEHFAALATEHSDDGAQNGGLYRAVQQGTMVAEFDAWIFDATRKSGDVGLVKTSFGYHFIYFVGKAGAGWEEAIATDLRSAAYTTAYETLKAATTVTFDDVKLQDIPA